jgi:hypothetical protein
VYGSFDYLREFTPKPVQSIEAVCAALAKNAVDIRPGMIIVFRSDNCWTQPPHMCWNHPHGWQHTLLTKVLKMCTDFLLCLASAVRMGRRPGCCPSTGEESTTRFDIQGGGVAKQGGMHIHPTLPLKPPWYSAAATTHRPPAPVLVVTSNATLARSCAVLYAMHVSQPFNQSTSHSTSQHCP